MNQAIAQGANGRILRRWFVWVGGVRKVTWKESEADVWRLVPGAEKVEPAPHMVLASEE